MPVLRLARAVSHLVRGLPLPGPRWKERRRSNPYRLESIARKVRKHLSVEFPDFKPNIATAMDHAVAMAEAADIKPTDVVLDPFGGPGFSSLVASYYKPKQLLLVDIQYPRAHPNPRDLERVWNAVSPDSEHRTPLIPIAANANRLPLADASVHKIISSPPYFLKRKKKGSNNRYESEDYFVQHVPELSRVMKPGGIAVFKTPHFWRFDYMAEHGFVLVKEQRLRGLNKLMVFRRT